MTLSTGWLNNAEDDAIPQTEFPLIKGVMARHKRYLVEMVYLGLDKFP